MKSEQGKQRDRIPLLRYICRLADLTGSLKGLFAYQKDCTIFSDIRQFLFGGNSAAIGNF